ncbi:MAG: 50S ribosomal protein L9 [Chloroflexi bacterium]|nr:50S ribosomal protein L9 [Chloroflexota bacterium]
MRTRVLFVRDVLPRYRAGDMSEVALGYARNFLIPKGLAVLATTEQLKRINTIKRVAGERREAESQSRYALRERLDGLTLTVNARVGEGGRLYGSVTNITLAEELKKALDVSIDRRLIALAEPIKEMGTYQVPIRLDPEINATITVVVESENRRVLLDGEQPPAEAVQRPEDTLAPQMAATGKTEESGEAEALQESETEAGKAGADVRREDPTA